MFAVHDGEERTRSKESPLGIYDPHFLAIQSSSIARDGPVFILDVNTHTWVSVSEQIIV